MKKFIYTIALVLLVIGACTERVEMSSVYQENILYVYSELTTDTTVHQVELTKSINYFSPDEIPAVSNALVQISDGTVLTTLIENPTKAGVYETAANFYAEVGKTYQLSITNIDIDKDGIDEEYTAESTVLPLSVIDSIQVKYYEPWEGWKVMLYADEPVETDNFYLFKIARNDTLISDTITNFWTSDDRFFNGQRANGSMVQYFDEANNDFLLYADTVCLEMHNVSKGYFNFVNQVQTEMMAKVPMFSGPSANPAGNISNGAVGFFSAHSVGRSERVYHGEIEEVNF